MCGAHNECCKKGGCHKDPIDHIDASYCLYGTKILLGYCLNKWFTTKKKYLCEWLNAQFLYS
jgi:hypothetical protein